MARINTKVGLTNYIKSQLGAPTINVEVTDDQIGEIIDEPVALYIATHNKTGLKYFGKSKRYLTEVSLQENYHGSGTYWKRHLNKYGDDVTMELYGVFSLNENNIDYVEPIALDFSTQNDIVTSEEWANQIPENGLDGGVPKFSILCKDVITGINKMVNSDDFEKNDRLVGFHRGRKLSETHRANISKSISGQNNGNYGRVFSEIHRERIGLSKLGNKYNLGKKRSEDSKMKMSESAKLRITTDDGRAKRSQRFSGQGNPMYGKKHSEDSKSKISQSLKNRTPHNKGKKDQVVLCPHCGKKGGSSIMKRWHFDKCKYKENISCLG
ncbi:head-tail adaptor [Vibrio phage VB_VaC_TDDLMA]